MVENIEYLKVFSNLQKLQVPIITNRDIITLPTSITEFTCYKKIDIQALTGRLINLKTLNINYGYITANELQNFSGLSNIVISHFGNRQFINSTDLKLLDQLLLHKDSVEKFLDPFFNPVSDFLKTFNYCNSID